MIPLYNDFSASVCQLKNKKAQHESCASCSVVPDSLWPHGLQPARLLCPWDSPGKNTGAGCRASSRGSSFTQGSNQVVSYMAGRFFNVWATREVFGANEDYSPGESIPGSSEKLLRRGRGKVSIYMNSVSDRGSCSQAHVLIEVCC